MIPSSIRPLHRALLQLVLPLAAGTLAAASAQTTPEHRQPVLVELFTSEDCSDCPPADALLARLDATQFVPGAQAIVLSEHVTYWDHEGWRDPYSLDEVTNRQKSYQAQFALDDIYTPQVVVDGANQMVGNNVAAVTKAVAEAAMKPKEQISIEKAQSEQGGVRFAVRVPLDLRAELWAVLAIDSTTTQVSHGENAGRTLHNVAVARVTKNFGAKAFDGRPLRLAWRKPDRPEEIAEPIRLVVFLMDEKTRHVDAVAEQIVRR